MTRQPHQPSTRQQLPRKSGALPALAMLFELLALVCVYFATVNVKFPPGLGSFAGLGLPYSGYAWYLVFWGSGCLSVLGAWFAIRGWKSSPLAAGGALILTIFYLTMSIQLWFPLAR